MYYNKSAEKKYKKTEFKKFIKDMKNGMKHDLKCHREIIEKGIDISNTGDYVEALYVSNYITWFFDKHFDKVV